MPIPADLHKPRTPGLFITGTDTGVGKTVTACLIADQWRRSTAHDSPRSRVGVLKPIATGCRREREGLVSPDAEELAHAADFDADVGDLDLINPVRFRSPLAPAAALRIERGGGPIEWALVDRSLRRLDERCDRIVIEGVGGLLVPLEQQAGNARIVTVLDLAIAVGFPVVVVCRSGLGTLNHSALTCQLIRQSGLALAGLVVNGYDADSHDLAMQTNREWLARQNKTRILATLPGRPTLDGVAPGPDSKPWNAREIPAELRDAIDATDFASLARPAGPAGSAGRAR